MRLIFCLCILAILSVSCKHNHAPDISNIKVDLVTERFEQDLFRSDTMKMAQSLDRIIQKYPRFMPTYLTRIINIDPQWSPDTIAHYIESFVTSYRPVYDTAEKVFKDFSPYEDGVKKGFRYVKFYFPSYKLPVKLITYIGPLDGFGDVLDEGAVYIGLHAHLGKDFSLYKTTWVQETYPDYITRRFEPSYISVSALNNIVLDLYPERSEDKSMIIQMVEKGKRLYLLSRFLPDVPEYKLIGYTEKQLKESYDHEAIIWALFIQNNLLQNADYNVIKNYVGEGPKTAELGDASPGNIGSFSGWQIVKKYMALNPATSMGQLMNMDAEQLFRQAKYKP